jgi:hypothetical protein
MSGRNREEMFHYSQAVTVSNKLQQFAHEICSTIHDHSGGHGPTPVLNSKGERSAAPASDSLDVCKQGHVVGRQLSSCTPLSSTAVVGHNAASQVHLKEQAPRLCELAECHNQVSEAIMEGQSPCIGPSMVVFWFTHV